MHVQSCCFPYKTYSCFDVLAAVRVVGSLQVHVQKLSLMQHRGCEGSLYNPDSGLQVALI